ncbi:hypothetical protein COCMIDRAFT_94912, partial [Bipolaris oryzae ATCC 44560]
SCSDHCVLSRRTTTHGRCDYAWLSRGHAVTCQRAAAFTSRRNQPSRQIFYLRGGGWTLE